MELIMKFENVNAAENTSLQISIPQKDSALVYVPIQCIKELPPEPVYNMEVDEVHNFSVNGGIIVHNCADALRYGVMGAWKYIKRWLPVNEKEEEIRVEYI